MSVHVCVNSCCDCDCWWDWTSVSHSC